MSLLYRDVGIVLRTYRLGETDRIVVLLTEQSGKVRAVARGARKATSKLGGRVEPLSHLSLLLRQSRQPGQLQQITQAETIDHFHNIRGDLDRLAAGDALVEACDLVSQDAQPDDRLYRMLLGGLRTLDAGVSPMLVPAFHLKLLVAEGVGPELDVCANCGADGPLVAFDPDSGGAVCRLCRRGVAMSPHAFELARMVVHGSVRTALTEPASAATHEVQLMATRAFEHHVERRLRAAHVL